MMMDSHAHLTSEEFPIDAEGAIARASAFGVVKIINVCTKRSELEKGLLLEQKYPGLIHNIGCTTPHDAEKETEETFRFFEKMAMEKKIVAIGETGFDDFIIPDNSISQKKVCKRYIELAIATNLPVVFHVRGDQAFKNLFELASEYPPFTGVIHCFTGNAEQAKKALDLGFYLSISGIVTFKKSGELQEVIKQIPTSRLLIETDSPWLSPHGFRGRPNEPAYLKVIAEKIASVLDRSLSEICLQTFENGNCVFC